MWEMTAFRRKKEEEGRRKKEDGRRKKEEEEEREVQCVSSVSRGRRTYS